MATGRNFMVGATFLGSMVLLGVTSMAIGALPFFGHREVVSARFPNVSDLQPGDAVLIHGYRVGMVDAIAYDPNSDETNPLRVDFLLRQPVGLTEDTEFAVVSSSALGGRHVEITPGDGPETGSDYANFVGTSTGDFLSSLATRVSEPDNIVNYLLANEEGRRQVSEALEGIRSFAQLLQDPVLQDDLKQGVAEIREVFRSLNASEGILGAVINDADLRDKLITMVGDIADGLREERGILGYALNNAEGKQKFADALSNLENTLRGISEQEGVVGELIHNEELATELREIVRSFNDIVHKLNEGEGTLGRALNDPRAWNEIVRLLTLGRETLEDVREQAPIATFVNAAFAGF